MKNQKISCTVYDCKYCDCNINKCSLNEIKVCNCDGCGEKETTMCYSYKDKNK